MKSIDIICSGALLLSLASGGHALAQEPAPPVAPEDRALQLDRGEARRIHLANREAARLAVKSSPGSFEARLEAFEDGHVLLSGSLSEKQRQALVGLGTYRVVTEPPTIWKGDHVLYRKGAGPWRRYWVVRARGGEGGVSEEQLRGALGKNVRVTVQRFGAGVRATRIELDERAPVEFRRQAPTTAPSPD